MCENRAECRANKSRISAGDDGSHKAVGLSPHTCGSDPWNSGHDCASCREWMPVKSLSDNSLHIANASIPLAKANGHGHCSPFVMARACSLHGCMCTQSSAKFAWRFSSLANAGRLPHEGDEHAFIFRECSSACDRCLDGNGPGHPEQQPRA